MTCGGRKLAMELICSKCGSDATPLPCIFDSSSHAPHSTNHIAPSISTKALPQTFSIHQLPRIYSGKCLMYDRKLSSPLAIGDQVPSFSHEKIYFVRTGAVRS